MYHSQMNLLWLIRAGKPLVNRLYFSVCVVYILDDVALRVAVVDIATVLMIVNRVQEIRAGITLLSVLTIAFETPH